MKTENNNSADNFYTLANTFVGQTTSEMYIRGGYLKSGINLPKFGRGRDNAFLLSMRQARASDLNPEYKRTDHLYNLVGCYIAINSSGSNSVDDILVCIGHDGEKHEIEVVLSTNIKLDDDNNIVDLNVLMWVKRNTVPEAYHNDVVNLISKMVF